MYSIIFALSAELRISLNDSSLLVVKYLFTIMLGLLAHLEMMVEPRQALLGYIGYYPSEGQ